MPDIVPVQFGKATELEDVEESEDVEIESPITLRAKVTKRTNPPTVPGDTDFCRYSVARPDSMVAGSSPGLIYVRF